LAAVLPLRLAAAQEENAMHFITTRAIVIALAMLAALPVVAQAQLRGLDV